MPKLLSCHNVDITFKLTSTQQNPLRKMALTCKVDDFLDWEPLVHLHSHLLKPTSYQSLSCLTKKHPPKINPFFPIFGDKMAAKLKYCQNQEFQCLHPSVICSLCFSKILRSLILVIPSYNHLLCVPEYLANIPNLTISFCNWC